MEPEATLPVLSPAQVRVLECLGRGCSNAAIARELGISIPGVEYHLHRLFGISGTRNRVGLVMWWIERQTPSGPVERAAAGA